MDLHNERVRYERLAKKRLREIIVERYVEVGPPPRRALLIIDWLDGRGSIPRDMELELTGTLVKLEILIASDEVIELLGKHS
jgi:hypothetical protein